MTKMRKFEDVSGKKYWVHSLHLRNHFIAKEKKAAVIMIFNGTHLAVNHLYCCTVHSEDPLSISHQQMH
jgi:hypothetical protein